MKYEELLEISEKVTVVHPLDSTITCILEKGKIKPHSIPFKEGYMVLRTIDVDLHITNFALHQAKFQLMCEYVAFNDKSFHRPLGAFDTDLLRSGMTKESFVEQVTIEKEKLRPQFIEQLRDEFKKGESK